MSHVITGANFLLEYYDNVRLKPEVLFSLFFHLLKQVLSHYNFHFFYRLQSTPQQTVQFHYNVLIYRISSRMLYTLHVELIQNLFYRFASETVCSSLELRKLRAIKKYL